MAIRTRRYRNERLAVIAALGAASLLACSLEVFRELRYETEGLRFLFWNLMLAWIPLLLSVLIYDRYRAGTSLARLTPALAAWLLFLPNAPYTMTDFVHLSPRHSTPLWLEGVVLSAFGWTGLLLGLVSIYLVHAVIRHRFGAARSWPAVGGVLVLVSVGICIGRFLRWNSWDVVVRPGARLAQLTARIADPTSVVHGAVLTLLLTVLLAGTYFAFYALVGLDLKPRRSEVRSRPRADG